MKKRWSATKIVFIGMLAAVVLVVTLYRFPLLGSQVHFANTMCLLSGLLMGPFAGGLAAGLGSALYDVLLGGTDQLDYKVWYLQGVLEQLQPYQAGVIDLTFDQEGAARFSPWAEDAQTKGEKTQEETEDSEDALE